MPREIYDPTESARRDTIVSALLTFASAINPATADATPTHDAAIDCADMLMQIMHDTAVIAVTAHTDDSDYHGYRD